MVSKICFICNCVCVNYSKNLFEIKSKYSETRLLDVLVKILGDVPFKREFSIECDENLVCSDCLNKINQYDLACLTAKRVEEELREMLAKTALSLATECDTPIEPTYQLFTESREMTELRNDIEIEESNSSDCSDQTIAVLDKEPDDEIEGGHYAPRHFFRRVEKISIKHEVEPKFRNQLRMKRIQRKKATVPANCCYTCQTCNLSFNKNSLYEQHMKHHKGDEDQLKCQYCALELLDETALANHMELHENSSSPYQCVLCEKIFKTKAALKRHMRIHSGLKFYQCERCGKEFVHKSSFQMHILAHDDIRQKQCGICLRMFRSSSHLNRHLRIHTGAKPWSCDVCNQSFAQRYNLTVHRRIHERGRTKSHLCNFCGSAFARKSKLDEHLQKNHEAVTPHTAIGNDLTGKRPQHTQKTK